MNISNSSLGCELTPDMLQQPPRERKPPRRRFKNYDQQQQKSSSDLEGSMVFRNDELEDSLSMNNKSKSWADSLNLSSLGLFDYFATPDTWSAPEPTNVIDKQAVLNCNSYADLQPFMTQGLERQQKQQQQGRRQQQHHRHQKLSQDNGWWKENNNNGCDDEKKTTSTNGNYNYTQMDVIRIVADDKEFAKLKKALKQQRVVTNLYCEQMIHVYVKHRRERIIAKANLPPRKNSSTRRRDKSAVNAAA